MTTTENPAAAAFISPQALLSHWQGHRRLTKRVIEAFPEDQLFSFTLGSMRPFGAMAMEFLALEAPLLKGIATGVWDPPANRDARPKAEVLRLWDESTEQINVYWSQIPSERFLSTAKAFGQYEGYVHDLLLYVIDNEIHHRGQGWVYLNVLGIATPLFYERH